MALMKTGDTQCAKICIWLVPVKSLNQHS